MPLKVIRRATASGVDTLEVSGILLHSRYDPRKEAARMAAEVAAATHVLLLSPGLGYLADALSGREVILVERHSEIADEDPRRRRLVAPDPLVIRDLVLNWEGLETGRLAVLSGVVLPEDEDYYERVRTEAVRAVEMRAEEVATIRGFSAIWETNLSGNRHWIEAANANDRGVLPFTTLPAKPEGPPRGAREQLPPRTPPIACNFNAHSQISVNGYLGVSSGPRALDGPGKEEGRGAAVEARWLETTRLGWKGRTVAVLAAGPSLRDDLPILAEAICSSNRVPIIIAVDSALPAVLAAGVLPDAVVTIDPQPVKVACLDDLGGIPLIASVLSPPVVLARARRLLLFGQGHPGEAAHGVPRRAVQSEIGGSVATAAVALAVSAGASTLLLIGQDLSVDAAYESGGATHIGGTHFERRLLSALGRFTGGARALLRNMAPSTVSRVPAVGGGTVATTPILDSYRLWLRDFAMRQSEVVFVQTSRRGAAIGIPARPLAEALQLVASTVDRTESV